jgi:hypothetical protein
VRRARAGAKIGHPSKGAIWLNVNGKQRQKADLSDMIWSVPEQIAFLSEHYTLEPATSSSRHAGRRRPGQAGDELHAGIDGVGELKVKIVAGACEALHVLSQLGRVPRPHRAEPEGLPTSRRSCTCAKASTARRLTRG